MCAELLTILGLWKAIFFSGNPPMLEIVPPSIVLYGKITAVVNPVLTATLEITIAVAGVNAWS